MEEISRQTEAQLSRHPSAELLKTPSLTHPQQTEFNNNNNAAAGLLCTPNQQNHRSSAERMLCTPRSAPTRNDAGSSGGSSRASGRKSSMRGVESTTLTPRSSVQGSPRTSQAAAAVAVAGPTPSRSERDSSRSSSRSDTPFKSTKHVRNNLLAQLTRNDPSGEIQEVPVPRTNGPQLPNLKVRIVPFSK